MSIRKFLTGAATAAVAFSGIATGVAVAGTFSDVPSTHWAYSYVEQLVEDGVITASDSYRPDDQLNRAELVKIALKAAGIEIDTEGAPTFTDVPSDAWYYEYVATAAKKGIVAGYTNADGSSTGKFGPSDVVTRAAATKILVNAFGIAFDLTPASSFGDVTDTSAWYYPYVVTAYNQSILDGYSNGKFGPNDAVTRAQIAKLAVNAANPVERATASEGDDDDDDDDTPATVSQGDGTLLIELSDETPDSATLPLGAEGVVVAAFDLTASDTDDVTITNIAFLRSGLGGDNTLSAIALFDEDGLRISKAKSFTSSDDTASVSILGQGLTIDAGTTQTVFARVNVGTTASEQFAIAISDVDAVTSNAAEVEGDFPVVAETMQTAGATVTASELQIQGNGMPADVKLGEQDATISKFKLKNNSSNNSDITVYGMTFKGEGSVDEDTEMVNYNLYLDGELVASTEYANDKYVSFTFEDGLTIKESKSITGEIRADIVGGASKTAYFNIDNDLDVSAIDEAYGYGAAVTATNGSTYYNDVNSSTSYISIEAGELSIIEVDPPYTQIRADKDDVVLGSFKLTVNAGQDLELQKFSTDIVTSGANFDAIFETTTVELADDSATYDLTCSNTATTTATCADSDLSIRLEDGESVTFTLRADTKSNATTGTTVYAKISSIGSTGIYVVETTDDEAVTDVTPSSITYKTIDVTASSATVSVVNQSSSYSAVIGSKNVEALVFEVEAGEVSPLTLDEVQVYGDVVDGARAATVTVANASTNNPGSENVTVTYSDGTTEVAAIDIDNAESAIVVAGKLATALDALTYMSADNGGTAVVTVTPTKGLESISTAALTVTGTTFTYAESNDGTDSVMSNTRVNKLALYEGDYDEDATPLDEVSGSQIASTGVATFNNFKSEIAKNGTVRYTVVIDVINDVNQSLDTVNLRLAALSLEDDDSDDLSTATISGTAARSLTAIDTTDGAAWAASDRLVTIKGAGTLDVDVDNTDSKTDKAKWVLGGNTTKDVSAFDIVANNEAVKIKDLEINETSTGTLKNAISEVVLYDVDGSEIARKSVTSDTVTFTDVNYVVEEGSTTIYVGVAAHKIGKDYAGSVQDGYTFEMTVSDAEGNSSGKTVDVSAIDSTADAGVLPSLAFGVIPTHISSVEYAVKSGYSLTSKLTSGSNDIYMLKVTTEDDSNRKLSVSEDLKTVIKSLAFTVAFDTSVGGGATPDLNSITLEKVGGSGSAITGTPYTAFVADTAFSGTVSFDLSASGFGTDDEIDGGATVYYLVKANITDFNADNDASIEVKMSKGYLDLAGSTLTVAGTALAGGEDPAAANVVVDGTAISVDIAAAASNNAIATAIAAAIDGHASFVASAASNVVTVTTTAGAPVYSIDASALVAAIDAADASDNDTTMALVLPALSYASNDTTGIESGKDLRTTLRLDADETAALKVSRQ